MKNWDFSLLVKIPPPFFVRREYIWFISNLSNKIIANICFVFNSYGVKKTYIFLRYDKIW